VKPIAVWLGALSYPLYAVHAPILRLFEAGLRTLSDDQALIGWLIAAPSTVLLAALFQRFYDAPVQAWLRRRGP
jgi:peptidoglycan/LPS O-acetylase OafA/YrhL